MRPSAQRVAQVRWAVRVALRLALLVALLIAAWTAYGEIGAWRKPDPWAAGVAPPALTPARLFSKLDATPRWLMIAAGLLGADLFALRLLVPLPRRGCPGCGYAVDASKQARCPECGLDMTTERLDA